MDHAFGVDPPTFSLDPLQDDGAMQCCARHKKWTTHSALTPRIQCPACHIYIEGKIISNHFFASDRATSLRLPQEMDPAFGFDPLAFGFDPLQSATPVTFLAHSRSVSTPCRKRGPDIAPSVSTPGTRSVSTPSPYYTVLQRTTPVLLCTTKYYSSTTLYCKVLLQYYSVLQSTTPVLLCTTKYYSVLHSTTTYYSSTTLYYKVLLQYYSVLQSTTPVLYSVLQRTTPVLLCTTKYYSVLHSTTTYYTPVLFCTTKYYCALQSTTPVLLCTTLHYKVLLQYYSVLQSTTPVLLCTATYYSNTTLY